MHSDTFALALVLALGFKLIGVGLQKIRQQTLGTLQAPGPLLLIAGLALVLSVVDVVVNARPWTNPIEALVQLLKAAG